LAIGLVLNTLSDDLGFKNDLFLIQERAAYSFLKQAQKILFVLGQ